MHHNARNKIMYCILFRGGGLNRFKVLPDLGGSGPPRGSWPTYIFYLVSLDARNKNIYVFSLRVGISTVFNISDHFLFQGNQDHPRGLWPTYQLMCHHARNKNIHCLETESQSFLEIFGHFQFLGAAWPQGQYIIFHSLPVMSMYDSEDPMYIFLMLFKLLPFTKESTISPVVFYPRPYTLWPPPPQSKMWFTTQ